MAAIMRIPDDHVERLNMAAQAVESEVLASSARWFVLFVNALLIWGSLSVRDRFDPPWIVPVFILCAIFAAGSLWTNWRYKLYALAVFLLGVSVGSLVCGKVFDSEGDQFRTIVYAGIFGIPYLLAARRYATAHAPGREKEQAQAESCWEILRTPERSEGVIQFSTGSFWTNSNEYRLLNRGSYWAVARFHRGFARILPKFSIVGPDAVKFMVLPDGEMMVSIGSDTMRAFNVSPPMFGLGHVETQPKTAA